MISFQRDRFIKSIENYYSWLISCIPGVASMAFTIFKPSHPIITNVDDNDHNYNETFYSNNFHGKYALLRILYEKLNYENFKIYKFNHLEMNRE